jgi:hypothetical protein
MIAIARKREQNSAYAVRGEARPGMTRHGPRLFVAWKPRQPVDSRQFHAADLNPPLVCVSKQFPPRPLNPNHPW